MNRGSTLIELLAALAAGSIIALACAQLIKAGILTYAYTARQNHMLDNSKKALSGEGARNGVLWTGRSANSVQGLQASNIAFATPDGASAFYVSNRNLYRSSGTISLQANFVNSMTAGYYNMNDSGLLVQSTAANMATLVTVLLAMQSQPSNTQKSYSFFSGARLRNHP